MNILIATDFRFNPQVKRLAFRVRQLGHSLSLLQIGHGTEDDLKQCSEGLFDTITIGLKAKAAPRRTIADAIYFASQANLALRRLRPDLVWCLCMWDLSLVVAVLARARKIKVVTTVCGSDFYSTVSSERKRIRMRLLAMLSEIVATTAKETENSVVSKLRIPVEKRLCMHWGIAIKHYAATVASDSTVQAREAPFCPEGVVINLGRLLRKVSFPKETLEALKILKDAGIAYRAFVLLSGYEEIVLSEFRALVATHSLGDRIVFTDSIDTEVALGRFYRTCDITLNLISRDQLGASILECLAAGNTVISTDLPVYKELKERGVNLHYVSLDPTGLEIASAIRQEIDKKATTKAKENLSNQSIISEYYDFERNTSTMIARFASLVSKKHETRR